MKIFHFLGGLTFALILIGIAAIVVMIGTILESKADSHLYASHWVYGHPLFAFLLGLFFINILFSALRRWPFKRRHIPFLTTHLGLLMVILGTILKNQWGTQGHMLVMEGSGSQQILLPHTYALQVEKKNPTWQSMMCPLCLKSPQQFAFSDLQIKLLGSFPHVKETLETWIKGDDAYISGLPLIPVHKWKTGESLPAPFEAKLRPDESWNIVAMNTDDIVNAVETVYFHDFTPTDGKLDLHYTPSKGIQHPTILIDDETIALQGDDSLYNRKKIDLVRSKPLLLLVNEHLFAFDRHGRIYQQPFPTTSMIVYDEAFGGYATPISIPFPSFAAGRKEKEMADQHTTKLLLREALNRSQTLAPPLEMLKKGCEKQRVDFVDTFMTFLQTWHQEGTVLMPHEYTLHVPLYWSQTELKGAQWISMLFDQLEGENDILEALKKHNWPFLTQIKEGEDIPTQLAQQLFASVDQLPSPPLPQLPSEARLLSAYLKAYGLDYGTLHPIPKGEIENFARLDAAYAPIVLESPLTPMHKPQPLLAKWENNQPCIFLEIKKGDQKQLISLAYDPQASGLKWPVLNGEYLVSFLPQHKEIPYHVRLRQARQINYPDSNQPYSYECDVLIGHTEKTLSMNKVHETWEGYRFYMAGLSTTNSGIKVAQIVINHDPVKYFLTYPGAIIAAFGIILLFWMRPYRQS